MKRGYSGDISFQLEPMLWWAHVEDDDFGTADWTISDAGRITGTACNTAGECGTIVGHVDADGSLVVIASIGYPHKGRP